MSDIFISYARADRERVRPLAQALEEEGWEVWWDPLLESGRSFQQVINEALGKVRCVVGLWSERSLDSKWVLAETLWAYQRERLVTLCLDDGLHPKLPVPFNVVHADCLAGWDGARTSEVFQKLVSDLTKLIGPPPAAEAKRKAEEEERQRAEQKAKRKAKRVVGKMDASALAKLRNKEQEADAKSKAQEQERRLAKAEVTLLGFAEPSEDMKQKAREAAAKARRYVRSAFRDTLKDGSKGPAMVVIPAGVFQMGNSLGGGMDHEQPVHEVDIAKPFAMSKYPVTFADYERFARATDRKLPSARGWGRENRPVINVSWEDAVAYTEWLSSQMGKDYRLPTEAEWEYAARAGTETEYWWGNEMKQNMANCAESGSKWSGKKTAPVGSFPANPFGLHDTAGNVYEWVQDCWHDNYEGAPTDGSAWLEEGGGNCGQHVLRGGSWNYPPNVLRSADRNADTRDIGDFFIGFRLAQDL